MYTIQIRDGNDNPIGEFDDFMELKFGKRLNNYGSCNFTVPISEMKLDSLVALRTFSIWIYREGILIWSGEMAMRDGNLDNQGGGDVTIYGFDWLELFRKRFTASEVTYSGVDAGELAWELIDTSQSQPNGDFGITLGTIEPTVNRDRTYNNQNIYEAIVNLSNLISGFDFQITNSKIFNVESTIGVDRTDSVVLEYGHNIIKCRVTEDYTDPTNRAIVLGQAEAFDELQRVERDDAVSQGIIKLRESVLSEMDISEIETFEEKGDALLRKNASPLMKLDIDILQNTPSIADFGLGDTIRLKIIRAPYNIDESYRVFGWDITYDSNNNEKLSLVLGKFTL